MKSFCYDRDKDIVPYTNFANHELVPTPNNKAPNVGIVAVTGLVNRTSKGNNRVGGKSLGSEKTDVMINVDFSVRQGGLILAHEIFHYVERKTDRDFSGIHNTPEGEGNFFHGLRYN